MKLKLLKTLDSAHDIAFSDDQMICSTSEGIYFYRKDTLEKTGEIIDFSHERLVGTPNNHYLLQLSCDNVFTIYDIRTKEKIGTIEDFPRLEAGDYITYLSQDEKHLYILHKSIPDMIKPFSPTGFQDIGEEDQCILYRYDFPSLNNRVKLFSEYHDMFYLPSKDEFLLADAKKNVFAWKDGEKVRPLNLKSDDLSLLRYSDKEKEIYFPYEFGLKVLNYDYEEIDKIEYLSDDIESFDVENIPPMFLPPEPSNTMQKEVAASYEVIPHRYTFAIVMENSHIMHGFQALCNFKVFDFKSGETLLFLPLVSMVSGVQFALLDEHKICIYSYTFCYVFELVNDD